MVSALVVDDSAVVRKVARRLLEERGYAVSEAEDSATALGLLAQGGADLILLDWQMPQVTGADLVRQLRAQGAGQAARLGDDGRS